MIDLAPKNLRESPRQKRHRQKEEDRKHRKHRKDLTPAELAKQAGLSRIKVRRLAKIPRGQPGHIPGTKFTTGGHARFKRCPALNRWIVARLNELPGQARRELRELKRLFREVKEGSSSDIYEIDYSKELATAGLDALRVHRILAGVQKGIPSTKTLTGLAAVREDLSPVAKLIYWLDDQLEASRTPKPQT